MEVATAIDKNELFMSNQKLVYFVINKKFKNVLLNHDREEIVQVGNIGLWKAIEKYDSNYETTFSTYAVPMISWEIQRHLRDYSHSIKISRKVKSLFYQYSRLLGLGKGKEEICIELNVTKEELQESIIAMQSMNYLQQVIHEDKSKCIALEDKIALNYNLESEVVNKVTYEDYMKVFSEVLIERDYKMLLLRMEEKGQIEISEIIGISQVQVSRVLNTKIKPMFLDIKGYLDGNFTYKKMISKIKRYYNLKNDKSDKKKEVELMPRNELNLEEAISSIVKWAKDHPGEFVYVSPILRENGIWTRGGESKIKVKAEEILKNEGHELEYTNRYNTTTWCILDKKEKELSISDGEMRQQQENEKLNELFIEINNLKNIIAQQEEKIKEFTEKQSMPVVNKLCNLHLENVELTEISIDSLTGAIRSMYNISSDQEKKSYVTVLLEVC